MINKCKRYEVRERREGKRERRSGKRNYENRGKRFSFIVTP